MALPRPIMELFMSDKLGRVWREVAEVYFKALVRNLPGGSEGSHEKPVRVAVSRPRFEHRISEICIKNVKHLIATFRFDLKERKQENVKDA
jgi:hypothetical protein